MSLNDQTYQKMERYLNDTLSPEEKSQFESELATNKQLANELQLFKAMEGYLSENSWVDSEIERDHPSLKEYTKAYLSNNTKEVAGLLEKIGQNAIAEKATIETVKDRKTINMWQLVRVAAVVLILLGATWFFTQPDKLTKYANNLDHEEIVLAQRGTTNENLAAAEEAFNNEQYEDVIPFLLAEDGLQRNYTISLALAISYYETDELVKAEKIFTEIAQSDALVKDDALWYLAMTSLKQENNEQTLNRLLNLKAAFPNYKPKEVSKLIKMLDK